MTQDIPPNADCLLSCFVCSPQGIAAIEDLERLHPWRSTRRTEGNIAVAVRMFDAGPGPHVVVAELGQTDPEAAASAVHELARTGARILILGERNDIRLYRHLVESGADDYIVLPATGHELLVAAKRRTTQVTPGSTEKRQGQVIAVCGCAGGSGASLLAENLASLASREEPDAATALIDLDLRFGSIAADLDIDETRGLFDALLSPERIDATFLGATMARTGAGPSVYSARAPLTADISEYEAGIVRFLGQLRGHFRFIVLDIPRDVLVRNSSVLSNVNDILLVLPPGFSGLASYARLHDWISDCTPTLKPVPVLSDLRRDAGLTRKELLSALKVKSLKNLPRSDDDITRSILKGMPVVAGQGRSAYARAVRELWTTFAARTATPARRPGWALFGGTT